MAALSRATFSVSIPRSSFPNDPVQESTVVVVSKEGGGVRVSALDLWMEDDEVGTSKSGSSPSTNISLSPLSPSSIFSLPLSTLPLSLFSSSLTSPSTLPPSSSPLPLSPSSFPPSLPSLTSPEADKLVF